MVVWGSTLSTNCHTKAQYSGEAEVRYWRRLVFRQVLVQHRNKRRFLKMQVLIRFVAGESNVESVDEEGEMLSGIKQLPNSTKNGI